MTSRSVIEGIRFRLGAFGRPGWVRLGVRSSGGHPGDSFTLPEFEGPIPCPRCGRTDCAWLVYDNEEMNRIALGGDPNPARAGLYCGVTGCRVHRERLRKAAEEAGLPRAYED